MLAIPIQCEQLFQATPADEMTARYDDSEAGRAFRIADGTSERLLALLQALGDGSGKHVQCEGQHGTEVLGYRTHSAEYMIQKEPQYHESDEARTDDEDDNKNE